MADGPKIENDTSIDLSAESGPQQDTGDLLAETNAPVTGMNYTPLTTLDEAIHIVEAHAGDIRTDADQLNLPGIVSGREITTTGVQPRGTAPEDVIDEIQLPYEEAYGSPNVVISNSSDLKHPHLDGEDNLKEEREYPSDKLEEQSELDDHPLFGRRIRMVPNRNLSGGDMAENPWGSRYVENVEVEAVGE